MSAEQARRGAQKLALPAIFALAILLGLYNASRLPIWYDEAITLLEISGHATPGWQPGLQQVAVHKALYDDFERLSGIVPMLSATDVHPPLYYFTALLWSHAAGKSLLSLRLLSLACVMASGALLALALRSQGFLAVLTASTLFLFAPFVQWSGINARDYSLALLLTSAVLFLCLRELRESSAEAAGNACRMPAQGLRPAVGLAAIAILSALAFYTHYFTLFATAPLLACILLRRLSSAPRAASLAVGLFLAMLAAIAPLLLVQMDARPLAFAGFQGPLAEAGEAGRLFLGTLAEPREDWIGWVPRIAFPLTLLGLVVYLLRQARLRPPTILLLVATILFELLLLALFQATDKSLKEASGAERYMVFLVPVMALLIGQGVGALDRQKPLLAWLVFASLALPAWNSWSDLGIRHQPWTGRYRVDPMVAALSELPAESVLAVVPRGHGRGTPGLWAHELEAGMGMIVAAEERDLALALEGARRARLVFIAHDESGSLEAPLQAFAASLEQLGFSSDDSRLYRR